MSRAKKSQPKNPSTPRRKTRVTIHDVAAAADVSIYTVSRVMNNLPGVNPETREKVLEVCRRMKMRPRPVARRKHFALVIPDAGSYKPGGYVTSMVFNLLNQLSLRGLGLSLFSDSQVPELSRQLHDGVFAMTWSEDSIDALASMESTPVVVINRFSLAPRFHVVGWDHEAEGRAVADYFINRGHSRLAFVAPPPATRNSTLSRLKGYQARCTESGISPDPGLVEILESPSQLVGALGRLVDRKADAIYFPGQEKLGIEALHILQRILKVRVPQDISVIGGENQGWSYLFDPPLTTVDAPLEKLAARCVDHMLGLLEHRSSETAELFIDTPIIERRSVADRRNSQASVVS
jgi:LacI family transcriptional regulator